MKHLILGGNGFIGQQVCARLLRSGEEVVLGTRRVQNDLIPELAGIALQQRRFDLTQPDFERLIAGMDVIHHYAWAHLPSTSALDPVGDIETNLIGTMRLLEALRRAGGKRLVFASSGGTIYGHGLRRPSREDDTPSPLSAYGICKLAAEHYIRLSCLNCELDGRVARISNPYGIQQNARPGFGVVAHFVKRIMAGQKIEIFGSGDIIRDFIHVDDLSDGLFALAMATTTEAYTLCNLGSGQGVSLTDLTKLIETLSGCTARVEYLPKRSFDVERNELDIDRIRSAFNWQANIPLRDGLGRYVTRLTAQAAE